MPGTYPLLNHHSKRHCFPPPPSPSRHQTTSCASQGSEQVRHSSSSRRQHSSVTSEPNIRQDKEEERVSSPQLERKRLTNYGSSRESRRDQARSKEPMKHGDGAARDSRRDDRRNGRRDLWWGHRRDHRDHRQDDSREDRPQRRRRSRSCSRERRDRGRKNSPRPRYMDHHHRRRRSQNPSHSPSYRGGEWWQQRWKNEQQGDPDLGRLDYLDPALLREYYTHSRPGTTWPLPHWPFMSTSFGSDRRLPDEQPFYHGRNARSPRYSPYRRPLSEEQHVDLPHVLEHIVRNVLGCAARSAQRQSMRVAMDSARQRATTRPTPAAKNDDYDDCDNDDDSGLGELEEKLLTRLSLTSDDGESREPIKVGNSGARAFPVKSSCPIVVFQAGSNITINVSDPVIRDQAGHRHTFVQKRKPARSDSFEKAKVRSDAYGDEVSAQYPQNKHQFQESSHDSFSASDANSRSGLGSGLKYRAGSFSSFKSRSGSESRSGGTRSSSTSDSSASAGSRRSTGTAKKVRDSSHPGHFDILTRRRHPELQRHDPLDQERRSQSSLLKKHLRLPQKSSLNPQPPRLLTEGHSLEQERKAWTKKDIRLLCHLVELHIPGATEAQRARRRAEAERKVLKARQEVNLKTTGNSSASASKAVKKMQKEFQNHRTHTKVAVPPKPIIPWVEIARELKRTDAGCSAKWEQLIKKDLNTERLAALSEAAATAAAATAAAATAAAATAPSVHSPTRRVVARPTTVVDLEDVADVNTDAESISVMESESGSESDETNAA